MKYIGENGSMGFHFNHIYEITTYIKNDWLVVKSREGLICPYDSLESMLKNWRFI